MISRHLAALAAILAPPLDLLGPFFALAAAVNAWAPPEDLPWKPLRLADPAGLATPMKFARAAGDPALCREVLSEGGVAITPVAARNDTGCDTTGALRLSRAALAPKAPVMSCSLALGYSFWMRHAVAPAAHAEFGEPVVAVDHFGTYACRNVYGRAAGRRSEHARANALDVAAFRTGTGRRISVAEDFKRNDARGRFLRRVRDGACPWFRAVLSPDYNAAHRDHLHLDFGTYRACR